VPVAANVRRVVAFAQVGVGGAMHGVSVCA
jgi:hypothetical protein